jgi:hypothetical protein
MSAVSNEPVLTAAGVTALLGGVLGFLVAHGIISNTDASTMTQVLAVVVPLVLPLILGWLARQRVTPTANIPPSNNHPAAAAVVYDPPAPTITVDTGSAQMVVRELDRCLGRGGTLRWGR